MGSKPGKTVFDMIIDGMAFMAGILLLLVTLFVSYAVIVRYLHFRPPVWVLQYTEYALLWITFLGAAWLLREGGHIRIDTVMAMLNSRYLRKVEIMDNILGCIVCFAIFGFGTFHTMDLFQRGIMDVKGVSVPKFAFFLIIPLGGLTLTIQFARDFFRQVRSKTGGEEK
jgi:C4-dicarboxylate transporter DctQ subunit